MPSCGATKVVSGSSFSRPSVPNDVTFCKATVALASLIEYRVPTYRMFFFEMREILLPVKERKEQRAVKRHRQTTSPENRMPQACRKARRASLPYNCLESAQKISTTTETRRKIQWRFLGVHRNQSNFLQLTTACRTSPKNGRPVLFLSTALLTHQSVGSVP